MDPHKESLEFVKKIGKVKEIDPPYELGPEAMAMTLSKAQPKAKIVKYNICFNHPAWCETCGPVGGECLMTVALTKNPPLKAVTINTKELHDAEKHGKGFSEEKLEMLREILG